MTHCPRRGNLPTGAPLHSGRREASTRFGQEVNRFATTIGVKASIATSVFGQSVTLNVQLGPPPPAGVAGPTGQVEFFEGSTGLGGVAVANSTPSFTLATLAPGSHLITAVYNGDTNYYLVRSAAAALTVTRAPTSTVLSYRVLSTTSGSAPTWRTLHCKAVPCRYQLPSEATALP